MSLNLTVLIPCKNEHRNLADAVASVRGIADEVLVADSGSTDGTIELARSLGCRVVERDYNTSGDFKNWAIPQAGCEWVLVLDADERVTPALAEEIRAKLANPPNVDGYQLMRQNLFLGQPLRYGSWRPRRLLRLFRRKLGRYVGATDHADVVVSSGRVGQIESPLSHFAFTSYDRYLPKLYRYADVQARIWHKQGRRTNLWQLVFRGPLRFAQDYFFRGGFFDGAAGLQSAVIVAYGSYLKQARLWELKHQGTCSESPQAKSPPAAKSFERAA